MSNDYRVTVEVTDRSAIYVNGTRITDRSTKWGAHTVIDTFECRKSEVRDTCLLRDHRIAVRKIDDPEY